jgi:hypothetical protein
LANPALPVPALTFEDMLGLIDERSQALRAAATGAGHGLTSRRRGAAAGRYLTT